MRKSLTGAVIVLAALAVLWIATTPPSYYEPAGLREIGAPPEALARVDSGDMIKVHAIQWAPELPGHDEVLPLPGTHKVLISGRDEWIWQVDTEKNTAEKLAFSPVSPTGARLVPGQPDQVYYCMARLDNHNYEHGPGLYRLDLNTRKFTEVVTRVPLTGRMREDGLEVPNATDPAQEMVYPAALKNTALTQLTPQNSRPLQFCNDLDVSADGRHIYISEPFSNPKASSGLGALPEGITLARNGRIWRYDTQTQSIGLVLENNVFSDGILIEYDAQGKETGVLVSETVNLRIGRAHFTGPKAGTYEVLWDNLPGLPDGMDRDDKGRIWVGLIKERTPLMNWIHRNPWIKPALLRIPPTWLPPSRGTAILGLSPDASQVIAYSHHDGSKVLDISVVVPSGDMLYLPSFYKDNKGLTAIPMRTVLRQP